MTTITTSEPLHGRWWLVHVPTTLAALALKAQYSHATVADLAWVLRPTAAVVGWLRRQPLHLDGDRGWMAPGASFIIAPPCAGVNFLIVVFVISALGFAHRFRSVRQQWSWLLLVAGVAYGLTIAVNSLRIVAAVALYRAEIHGAWLTPERVHRLAGTMIYLAGLWVAWMVLDRVSATLAAQSRESQVQRDWFSRAVLVPGAYIGMTVALPLLNGAWWQFGTRYLEHAITVSLLAVSTLLLLSLIGWVTCWPTATGDHANEQADDSGGRRRAGNC